MATEIVAIHPVNIPAEGFKRLNAVIVSDALDCWEKSAAEDKANRCTLHWALVHAYKAHPSCEAPYGSGIPNRMPEDIRAEICEDLAQFGWDFFREKESPDEDKTEEDRNFACFLALFFDVDMRGFKSNESNQV